MLQTIVVLRILWILNSAILSPPLWTGTGTIVTLQLVPFVYCKTHSQGSATSFLLALSLLGLRGLGSTADL
ncbi:hypothetical protein FKM82_008923 [Ascaphus truei]